MAEFDSQEGKQNANDSRFFHLDELMVIPYLKHCEECHRPANNLCSNCKGAYYCSRDCQTKHWKLHKMACGNVKQELAKFKKEEEKLNKSFCQPSNSKFGMFWAFSETRAYVQALNNLVGKYATIDSKKSAKEGVLYAMKLLYYSRKDTLAVSDYVSNLLVRLDQDQIAFDLIRGYACDIRNGLGRPNQPFLTDWQCDRSEDLFADGSHSFMSPTHIADYTLIKLRMLFYLHDVDAMYTFLALTTMREKQVDGSDNLLKKKLMGNDRVLHTIKDFVLGPRGSQRGGGSYSCRNKELIEQQVLNALKYGEKEANPRIWKAIINPQPLLEQAPPAMRFPGTAEDCYRALEIVQYTWYSSCNHRALAYLKQYVMTHGGVKYDARMAR